MVLWYCKISIIIFLLYCNSGRNLHQFTVQVDIHAYIIIINDLHVPYTSNWDETRSLTS